MSKEVTDYIACPSCKEKNFELRTVGFVNCEWALKGKLLFKQESRVFGEGQTYDGKLYTFKETNYLKVFEQLEIMAKKMKDYKVINSSQQYSSSSISMSNRQLVQPVQRDKSLQPEISN